MKEGLSYSDYYDEEIPYESKPVRGQPVESKVNENGMSPQTKRDLESLMVKLFFYLKTNLGLGKTPKVILREDVINANKPLGKTGYYNPEAQEIVLFVTNRHVKDILRSFAHEVIHHWQHEKGELEQGINETNNDPQYAQNNPHLRKMEKQAYLVGNMMFRDWEDELKNSKKKA